MGAVPSPQRAEFELDDADTIAACRRGDVVALGRVLERHQPALERLLFRVLGPDEAVQDVLQATLETAISAFPRFRGEASVKTWLSRIAVRLCREHFRKRARRRRAALHLPLAEPAPVDAERAYLQRLRLQRLHAHLAALHATKRTALLLHTIGHPIAEVAALTGASETATKSRVFWARRELLARAARDPLLAEWLESTATRS